MRDKQNVETTAPQSSVCTGEGPRITVWWCDLCGYWRQEQSTGVHAAVNPANPRGSYLSHPLVPVVFEMVSARLDAARTGR